ncbi:MATE family efflux transporter, partial [Faecalibacterium sp. DFI.5.82]|uniref:MATE family efflux transporter n=1 Tax=Faecalibacterium sp. DFI.5.82 TaxID=3031725 RepID=UPI0023AEBDF0
GQRGFTPKKFGGKNHVYNCNVAAAGCGDRCHPVRHGFLLFQFLPDKLLGLFSASEAMLAIGKPALRINCFHFLLAGMSIILSSTFQALGNGMFSLIISVCRQLVVLLPAAWLLCKTGYANMVWWSFVIAELVCVTLSF